MSLGTMLNSKAIEIHGTLKKRNGQMYKGGVNLIFNLIFKQPMGGYISMPCFSVSHAQMFKKRAVLLSKPYVLWSVQTL